MLKWDTLPGKKAIMMFKSLHKLAPVYLQDLFNEVYITISETQVVG